MIKTKLTLFAESALIDARSNNMSIINIVEDTKVRLPVILPRLTLISTICRDGDEPETIPGKFVITLGEVTIIESEFVYNFGGSKISRNIIEYNGFPLNNFGVLKATIDCESVNFHTECEVYIDSMTPIQTSQPAQPPQSS
jgi:hypothetical protein